MAEKPRGFTYAQAGVDIDAGNRMVRPDQAVSTFHRPTGRQC